MAEEDFAANEREDYSTAQDRADTIAGAPRTLDLEGISREAGVSPEQVQEFWTALGFALPPEDETAFSTRDVDAVLASHEMVSYGVLGKNTEMSLLRAVSHTAERLVWWQFETLVDDAAERFNLDDTSARMVVLDRIADLADIFEGQMMYAWRRHLSGIIRWVGSNISKAGSRGALGQGSLPLQRAVGFADLVGYTAISAKLDAAALDALVQHFTAQTRDIVSRGGGRVVKELGDGVMFMTDDPVRSALIALDLAQNIGGDGAMPPARVAMVWGRVLGRFGDVFGPTVNLASRLSALAAPGEVLIDSSTAKALEDESEFEILPGEPTQAPGLGWVHPHQLVRADTT